MALALAVFLLAALVIGWPWLSGRVTIPWDAKAHFQPQIQFLAQSLARGESPAWTPFVFSGHPQIADPQAMIFSPPFLVLALLNRAPSLWAVDATVLACVFLGGAALMLWFRDQGWHWAGGLIAALLGQGLEAFAAAQLGVFLHGKAGDLAAAELGEVSLIATDLLDYLPRAFRSAGPAAP